MEKNLMYYSTRGKGEPKTSAGAIKQGLAEDGGLFMPEALPQIDEAFIKDLIARPYEERAFRILSLFLTDYDQSDLNKICRESYSADRFGAHPAPVTALNDKISVMELWHGPTCAFKDMALQIMPRLLSRALELTGEKENALILVATSGDTGKAALEGYRDVDRVKIMVFYPVDGVSDIQKKQMASQEGANVKVVAIRGNFDDAQTGVKEIFSSPEIAAALHEKGSFLSSANSINWGRLAPQIVYYFSAYCDMVRDGRLSLGETLDVTVPTGNFGDIFAAYIAKHMGLPLGRLVCASNQNNILTDFFNTGVYDRNRPFYTTVSPSMDILISSNLERLLYCAFGSETVTKLMSDLKEKGRYEIGKNLLAVLREDFDASFCSEEECSAAVKRVFETYGYLSDTHTAVALACAEKCSGAAPMLVVSTASAYKFAPAVLTAITGTCPSDAFACLDELEKVTKESAPLPLKALKEKKTRFDAVCQKTDMAKEVLDF